MAQFIARPGGYDLSLAGPYRNRSANMQLHVLNASIRPLWRTLNHYLNPLTPAHTWYVPLGDRVVLSCVDIGEGRAGDEGLGSMHEVDVAFFIPALYCDPLPRRIVCFAPYLFVNNAWGMVMGREVHGFRKDVATSFASVDVDSAAWSHKARDLTHVEAWAMRRPGRDSRLERMKLVEIRPHEDSTPLSHDAGVLSSALIGSGLDEFPDAFPDEFQHLSADFNKLRDSAARLLAEQVNGHGVTMRLVFLRQFRDPRRSNTADVQQIVEAESIATLTGSPDVLRRAEVRLHDAASHPIADEVGLENDKWIRADLSLELNLDFVFNDALE